MGGEATEIDYSVVPDDFPKPELLGAVSGMQNKLLMVRYEDKFYLPGCTPPQLWQRWDICEDLAQKLSKKALESKFGKRSHMTDQEILSQYLPRMNQMNWGSAKEMEWIIRRMAVILDWISPI